MLDQRMFYSQERDSWNLMVNGEWYAEGTFDEIETMYENNRECELDELNEMYAD